MVQLILVVMDLSGITEIFAAVHLNLSSVNNAAISVHDEHFDVDNIDPASVFVGADDYEKLYSLSELVCKYIIVERMEFLQN